MDTLVIFAVAVAVLVGLGVAMIAVVVAVVRATEARMRSEAAAREEHAMRVAVEHVVAAAGQSFDARAAAGERELDLRSRAIHHQLGEMGGELRRMGELVTSLQRERAEQYGQLAAGLAEAIRTTTDLAGTARALREVLASPKARGQWGERMADDVLRAAGLIEGINYRKQRAIEGGTIPDVTFLLPDERHLHMDVKFPIDNYVRFLEASTDAEAIAARAAFLRDVRQRVREVATRGYADPATTPGYVLLFIPNESVYGFIAEHDRDLFDVSLADRVVLCSPFTLFAVLGVIRQACDTVQLARAGDDILDSLGRFNQQWDKFSEHVDKLGRQLHTVMGTYDELSGTRRRQLERRLEEIEAIRTERGLGPLAAGDDDPVVLRQVSA